ncbi:MAG: hypothetical protein HYZ69_03830, partial [Candidatus Colwellbacteria bacterium]|nr:hypothetical protein [Candidatus Colwellbacteria bacterium]
MLRLESSEGKNARKLIFKFILSITLLPILMFLFPNAVPFRFFEFWHIQGGLFQWLFAAWPIFAWGTSVTILYSIFTHNDPDTNREAESIIIYGLLFSVFAGV